MDPKIFQKRRQKCMEKIGQGVGVLFGATAPSESGRPHQDKDFYYLTGIEERNCVLVFRPKEGKAALFVPPKDPKRELWEGPMLGERGARRLGFQEVYPISKLEEKLEDFLANQSTLFYPFGENEEWDRYIFRLLQKLKGKVREGIIAPHTLCNLRDLVHEMRLIKDEAEIVELQKAAEITATAHRRAIQSIRAGIRECEIQAILEAEFRKEGAFFNAFAPIVASGKNALILHYITGERTFRKGELVLLDAGCEYCYYCADISRTVPVSGKFTEPQREIYNLVWKAQQAVIRKIRPGVSYQSLQDTAVRTLTRGLVQLGLLKGEIRKLIKEKQYQKFYMHKIGHWIGMDCHDVGNYVDEGGKSRKLQKGMVLTVEPGLYIPSSREIPKAYRGIGVRIEDDVLVTSEGAKVLTQQLPSRAEEIEELMSKG